MRLSCVGILAASLTLSSCQSYHEGLADPDMGLRQAADQITRALHPERTGADSPQRGESPPVPLSEEAGALPSPVDTAARAEYLSPPERQLVRELNKIRANPAEYAKTCLVPMRALYHDRLLSYPGEVSIPTHEGLAALDECIRVLESSRPVPVLSPRKGLSLAARDHAVDQGRSGATGHAGRDGSDPGTRIERYGRWAATWGENIDYGHSVPGRIVVSFLVDDGVPSRGHRKNILNPDFKCVGVSIGAHPVYRSMCVLDFAGDYE